MNIIYQKQLVGVKLNNMLSRLTDFKNTLIMIYGGLILLGMFFSDNILYLNIMFYLYTVSIMFVFSKSITDPRLLLVGFFTIYSTFYSLQVYFIEFSLLDINNELLATSLRYQFFALLVFITVLNLTIDDHTKNDDCYVSKINSPSLLSEKLIFTFLLPIVLVSIFFIFSSGASSKRELLDGGGLINNLSLFAMLIMTGVVILRASRLSKKLITDLSVWLFLLFSLFYMLLTGERDIFFRIVFILLLVFYDKDKRKSFFNLAVLILLLAVLLVPISQVFKAVLLSGSININKEALALMLSNEFISASRNFYSLLLYGVEHSYSYFFNDLGRAIIPSVINQDLGIQSTASWFNKDYRLEHNFDGTSGWGFSLVGQGYLMSPLAGIVVVMSIYGFILGKLYSIRKKSLYWYVFYLFSFTTAIYVIRGDLANFLSQVFKIGGLLVLLLYLSHRFLLRNIKT